MTDFVALTSKRLLNRRKVVVTHGSPDRIRTYCGLEIDKWYCVFPSLEGRSRLSCHACIAAKEKGPQDNGEEHTTCGNLELPDHEG